MKEHFSNKNRAGNLYGLIGYPLSHSFSKKYFEEKFEKEKITDSEFELFPLKNIAAFTDLLATQKNLRGLAVTIPHKEAVIPLLTEISDEAKKIGAVNCIKIADGRAVGYNTDVIGFERSLVPLLKPYHANALILGMGGAAKAVQYVLKNIGIDFLSVSRTKNGTGTIGYEDISAKVITKYNLVINCTPLGMSPDETARPSIPYSLLTPEHLLFDLIYKPEKTRFLQLGEIQGSIIKNGFEMLIIQAEENWKIWRDN